MAPGLKSSNQIFGVVEAETVDICHCVPAGHDPVNFRAIGLGRLCSGAGLACDPPDNESHHMFSFGDLFNWDRFITPSIIRIFYWLAVGLTVLAGLSAVFTALAMMAVNFFAGLAALLASLLFVLVGIMAARITAEFVLIMFRINENLDAIRQRGGM
jgi:hypothetical protein